MGIPLIAISCYLVALLAEGVDRNIQGPDTEEVLLVALLAEGVDRNLRDSARLDQILLSPSSRRAWIEMYEENDLPRPDHVALLAEGVDRNSVREFPVCCPGTSPSSRRAWIEILHNRVSELISLVALLAEGVDRNSTNWTLTGPSTVALLAEGVDRNNCHLKHSFTLNWSPSSRRAWIEIG